MRTGSIGSPVTRRRGAAALRRRMLGAEGCEVCRGRVAALRQGETEGRWHTRLPLAHPRRRVRAWWWPVYPVNHHNVSPNVRRYMFPWPSQGVKLTLQPPSAPSRSLLRSFIFLCTPSCVTFTVTSMTSSPAKSFFRSEEHTSELQSRPHLVCRLLL